MDILGNQVHPVVQILFPNNDAIFQDDNSPQHTARIVQAWSEEYEDALRHLPWPAKSPDLKIIEPLWLILESRVGSKFPPLSSLKQLESVLSLKVVQYSTMDHSELTRVCSEQDISCITGK
jgi:hypothetical protein